MNNNFASLKSELEAEIEALSRLMETTTHIMESTLSPSDTKYLYTSLWLCDIKDRLDILTNVTERLDLLERTDLLVTE